MQTENRIRELNKAINNLAPNIYFLSMMLGKPNISSEYKYDVDKSISYIKRYYEIKTRVEEAGYHAEIGSDLDYEEKYWNYFIDFSVRWNDAINSLKKRAVRKRCRVNDKKTPICDYLFSLPGGPYVETMCPLAEETGANPVFLKEQKEAICSAISGRREEPFISYQEYEVIIGKMFELKSMILLFSENYNYDEIDNYVSEVQEWIRVYIGPGEHIGSFRIMEFGEELFDRIQMIYFEDVSESELQRLAHDFEHLIFRISAYFGVDYAEVSSNYCEYTED